MKNKIFLIVIILIELVSNIFPQTVFRSGLFLHYSTGGVIWYNSIPNVPQLMNMYNTENNYTDNNAVTMHLDERFFPPAYVNLVVIIRISGTLFLMARVLIPKMTDSLQSYIANNPVIVIKTCWGGTGIAPMGNPADTLIIDDESFGSGGRTYYRTQWHWRSIIRIMQSYPDNFFVIWTGIPLILDLVMTVHSLITLFFGQKTHLLQDLTLRYGDFPANVYVFDAFHLLATPTENFSWGTAYWGMNPLYHDAGDNHPNVTGANVVAHPFVWETFNAAIAYEQSLLPVELISFYAKIIGLTIELNWSTATEINNYGFNVERALQTNNRDWKTIGFVNGNGNSNSPKSYTYEDKNIIAGKYSYRLKQIDNDGQFEYSKTVEVSFYATIRV